MLTMTPKRRRAAGAQVDGDRDECREMKDVVRGDIEASAEPGREELEPGDFTIAAVEDAARPEQEGTEQCCPWGCAGQQRSAAEPDEETDGRNHVRRHPGPNQHSRKRDRQD